VVKHFPPAYFALVMVTGIISIAAWDFQLSTLSVGLFAINLVAYAVLAALTGLRVLRYPRLFFTDMTDHQLGPGFFTAVAGSCILGAQFLLIVTLRTDDDRLGHVDIAFPLGRLGQSK
jgi:tellurite resistance protein TehA-like permease